MKPVRTAIGISCLALGLAGCISSSPPPLPDQLTLVPAAAKSEATPGLDLTYLYGTNQGVLNHVACDLAQHCWFSGVLGNFKTEDGRINSLVIRAQGAAHIAWAHSYEIDGTYTVANGLVPAPDGGALLYGNTFRGYRPEPVFEKLDAAGNPQWGGSFRIGGISPWSAFSDAIRLRDGGYLLAGSGFVKKHDWYGVLLKIDPAGHMAWAEKVTSRKDSTFLIRVTQLSDGNILAAGVNTKLKDIVLFQFSANGKLLQSSILGIRGSEIPIGLVPVPDGVDVAVDQKMPSGEEAAVVLSLGRSGKLSNATRYHYSDGFSPNSIVALTSRTICLYGNTTAQDNPQSLAIALDAKRLPVSALIMKGDAVFNSSALYKPGTLVFAGNRDIGTDQRTTPLLTRWTPAIKNDSKTLAKVRHDTVAVSVEADANATATLWDKSRLKLLAPGAMPFRSIYGPSAPTQKQVQGQAVSTAVRTSAGTR